MLCLTLAVSLHLPLTSSSAPAGCASVAESWALTPSVPLLESSGAKDSQLSANPGGARGFFLLGARACGFRKTPILHPLGCLQYHWVHGSCFCLAGSHLPFSLVWGLASLVTHAGGHCDSASATSDCQHSRDASSIAGCQQLDRISCSEV